ncbi:MAG: tyrosine-type recombinase/integrase [Chloroflexi bacterium]|jgi:integrase|nr:tyrosine-type recombinase/integrase [Chloroflexota bacterium]
MAKFLLPKLVLTKYGTYCVRYYNPDGRLRRLSVGSDERQAQRQLAKWTEWLLDGKDPEREMERIQRLERVKALTAREFYPDFLDGHGSKRSEKTQVSYRNSWQNISQYSELVDISLGELTPDLFERYIRTRQELNGVSSNTVRIEFMMLSKMLGYAVRKGILPSNPLHGRVELPPKPSNREVRLSNEQIAALIQEIRSQVMKDIVEFAVYGGKRKEEILGLRIENVRIIDLPKPAVLYSVTVKGGSRQSFKASKQAAKVLHRAIGGRREGYVFVSPKTGTRFAKNAGLPSFHRAVKKLGLVAYRDGKPVKFTFHDLRHAFTTDLMDNGADIRDVQMLLGHKSVTVTEIYAAPSRGSAALELQRGGR